MALLELEGALQQGSRDGVSVRYLAEHVCSILDARPTDSDGDGDGATECSDAHAVAVLPVTPTAARAQARQRVRDKHEREQAAQRQKLESVSRKLCLLLEGDESASNETIVSGQNLDMMFQQYTHLLGASPSALQRDWQTGQTVLQALNGLQGEDEMKVYSGIQTRKGLDLYLQIVHEG